MNGVGINGDLALEAAVFGKALLTGAALGVYFDAYRILRRFFRFGYAMILAQDLLFWLTGAVGVFFASVVASGGRLRIFFVLAVFAGWAAYAATVGALLMSVADIVSGVTRRLLSAAENRLFRPVFTRVKSAFGRMNVSLRERNCRFLRNLRKK